MSTNADLTELIKYFETKIDKKEHVNNSIVLTTLKGLMSLPKEDAEKIMDFVRKSDEKHAKDLALYEEVYIHDPRSTIVKTFIKNIYSPLYTLFENVYVLFYNSPNINIKTDLGTDLVIHLSKTTISNDYFLFLIGYPGEDIPFMKVYYTHTLNEKITSDDVNGLDTTPEEVLESVTKNVASQCSNFQRGLEKYVYGYPNYTERDDSFYNLDILEQTLKLLNNRKNYAGYNEQQIKSVEESLYTNSLPYILKWYNLGEVLEPRVLAYVNALPPENLIKTKEYLFIKQFVEKDMAFDRETGEKLPLGSKTKQYKDLHFIKGLLK